MVGSYFSMKQPETNCTVSADLPTPPDPKTTTLNSRIVVEFFRFDFDYDDADGCGWISLKLKKKQPATKWVIWMRRCGGRISSTPDELTDFDCCRQNGKTGRCGGGGWLVFGGVVG